MELFCCASSSLPRSLPHHHRRCRRLSSSSTGIAAVTSIHVRSLSFTRTSPQPSLFLGFPRVRCSASDEVSTFVSDRAVEEKEATPMEEDQVEVEAAADVAPPPASEAETSEDEAAQSEDEAASVATEELLVNSAIAYGVTSTEESAADSEQNQVTDILKQLNLELDSEDTLSIVVYGSGALVTLWLSSVVVSVLDSIPLLPKVMELVGLGFSIWFTSKYLIFKERREELFSKIEDIKDQILGSVEK